MATTKEFMAYVLDQLSGLEEITSRKMMGEYIVYYRGKIVLLVCDNRCLVKDTEAVRRALPDCALEPPYEGAKPMPLLGDALEDRALLEALLPAMFEELPYPKPRRRKRKHDET